MAFFDSRSTDGTLFYSLLHDFKYADINLIVTGVLMLILI